MKKILALVFAMAAVFCFAGCENGKCDECGDKHDLVEVIEELDGEYCPACAIKVAAEKLEKELKD